MQLLYNQLTACLLGYFRFLEYSYKKPKIGDEQHQHQGNIMQSREIEHAGPEIEGQQQHPGDRKVTKHGVKTIFLWDSAPAGQQKHGQTQAETDDLQDEPAVHRDIFVLLYEGGENWYLDNDHQDQCNCGPNQCVKDPIQKRHLFFGGDVWHKILLNYTFGKLGSWIRYLQESEQ
jgi:hypothetical protein